MAKLFNFRIAYADTDAGGIVYHGRYIEIAERARMEFMYTNFKGISFVLRDLNIKYIKPLKLGDLITVETNIIKHSRVSFVLEQKFIKDNEVYAKIELTSVSIGEDMKLKKMSDEVLQQLLKED